MTNMAWNQKSLVKNLINDLVYLTMWEKVDPTLPSTHKNLICNKHLNVKK